MKVSLMTTFVAGSVAAAAGVASAAIEPFTGYSGNLWGNNGGSASGSIAWTSAWGDTGFGNSPDIASGSLGTVNTVTSSDPYASKTLGYLEATRSFTPQSNTVVYVSSLVQIGSFASADNFGGIGLFEGGTEKFLVGQRYQATQWGATTSNLTDGGGQDSATSIVSDTTALLTVKIDQVNNQLTMWVNPDFAQTEGANTPAFIQTWSDGNDDIDQIRLRGGNFNAGSAVWRFDNIEVSGSTPFVPEPASLAMLGLGGLAMLRRRK